MSRRQKVKQRALNPAFLAVKLFDKGDFKEALKQARLAVRKNPNADNQQLLEQVMFQRARQLHQHSLPEQCLELLETLARSATHPKVCEQLPELLYQAGVLDRFPKYRDRLSSEHQDSLRNESFDREVYDKSAGRGADAELVRSALVAVERGDDSHANELLRGVARQSPMAEWRLFVRGLMAWYRRDLDAVEPHWSRLDPNRAPARIVVRLRQMDQFDDHGPVATERNSQRLESLSPTSRLISRVEQLRKQLDHGDSDDIFNLFLQCKRAAGRCPEMLQRIVLSVVAQLIRSGDRDGLRRLKLAGVSPLLDPNWNRAMAMTAEENDESEIYAWQKYIRDLDRVPSLSEEDRGIAKSLVYLQMSDCSLQEMQSLADCDCGASHKEEIDDELSETEESLNNSIRAFPGNTEAWDRLNTLYEVANRPDEVIATGKRRLEVFPDHFETLSKLGNKLLLRNVIEARDFLLRAWRLRPLDEIARASLSSAHAGCARSLALDSKFTEARQELIDAGKLAQDNITSRVNLLVRSAVVEYLAGNKAVADAAVTTAEEMLEEPTVAQFYLTVEAIRARLPAEKLKLYERQWQASMKRACRSQTAGELSKLMSCLDPVEYKGKQRHVELVLGYLARCSRVQFTEDDLLSVCALLQLRNDDNGLLEKNVEKGRKKFPNNPWFHLTAGQIEVERGEFDCKRKRAFNCFNKAIEACKTGEHPDSETVMQAAREGLSFLDDVGLQRPPRMQGMPDIRSMFDMFRRLDPAIVKEMMDEEMPEFENMFNSPIMRDVLENELPFFSDTFGQGKSRSNRRR
ncbi:MAG: hypothetical protein O3A00_12950 [Planctomycetota bacterium]|nr:hypothetical protein [Planctomycetota bacterium]